ncbi:MAG: flagellar hook-length control protein FliK [Rhodocyclales bacterium]|nr:flagellar hook-length control protein FliK [Rhodocyclales bacterium]
MVMIPTDVGIQVRNQTEPGTHPIRAIGEIPSDLPELRQGQVFSARIQEVLPENSYKAVVAGRLLTLSLPEGAKAGDTLELVVVGHTPRAILAQRSDGAGGTMAPFDNANLSRAGQLIASLLGAEGEAPPPANLSRGGPVLVRVPANAAEIARELPSSLSRAVAGSGMFYESHQVQWALGQRPLASLLTEPQGRHSRPALLLAAAEGSEESALAARRESAAPAAARDFSQAMSGREHLPAGLTDSDAAASAPARPVSIPDELRPLIQQQLEAGASNRLVWQGEIWPDQTIEWEIRRDGAGGTEVPDAQDVWQTRLRLSLPRLGEIDVRLQFSAGSVNVMLDTPEAASGSKLQAALPALQQAFSAAGLNLAGAQVKREAV